MWYSVVFVSCVYGVWGMCVCGMSVSCCGVYGVCTVCVWYVCSVYAYVFVGHRVVFVWQVCV